jgi:DNA-binding NtrC family response regulator
LTAKGRVLVVDDEANARSALAAMLADEGYETEEAEDGAVALDAMAAFEPDVVLTDLKMPNVDGLELVKEGKRRAPTVVFVVMTAFGSIETAVEAIKRGADNYLTKPLDMDAVSAIVGRALESSRTKAEVRRLRERIDERFSFRGILGDHPSMQRVLKRVARVAPSRATVLVCGETGTGKELIASAIHHHSDRKGGPFVRLNCAALADSLLESELFGHERGSFTGATGRRKGRLEEADGGTLFLDEVSEIPPATQVKLLRFLQERELERVGGNETIAVDTRVVAATNRDLREMVEEGSFREDLYYRLNVVQIDLPPLRARRTDVPILAQAFLHRAAEDNGIDVERFSDEAIQALLVHSWPGNVRELQNAVERAVVLCESDTVGPEQLLEASAVGVRKDGDDGLGLLIPGATMAEIERIAVERTLEAVGGSTARAADLLGISRRKIQYRLKEWAAEDEDAEADDD